MGSRTSSVPPTSSPSDCPSSLAPLARLAFNYRWSWLPGAPEMFRSIDPERFELSRAEPGPPAAGGVPARVLRRDARVGRAGDGARGAAPADLRASAATGAIDSGASGRLPVRRVRRPRVAAGLLRGPRRAGRRPAQGGLRPGAAARRRRAHVPQGLLPPTHRRRSAGSTSTGSTPTRIASRPRSSPGRTSRR